MADNSGQAFPIDNGSMLPDLGPTKREWFAGMAMQGMLACPTGSTEAITVSRAFRYADAMLKEASRDDA